MANFLPHLNNKITDPDSTEFAFRDFLKSDFSFDRHEFALMAKKLMEGKGDNEKKEVEKVLDNVFDKMIEKKMIEKSFLIQRQEIISMGLSLPPLLKPLSIPEEYQSHLFKPAGVSLQSSKIIKDEGLNISERYRIALLDTGVKVHPDLHAEQLDLRNSNDDNSTVDAYGHGTHVAGIMAANGKLEGMAPGARIVSYKITNSNYSYTSWYHIAEALEDIIKNYDINNPDKISVVNLSFNAFNNLDPKETISERLSELIAQLISLNVPLVVSSGNYFDAFADTKNFYGLAFPANLENVIACGACCFDGSLRNRRNQPKGIKEVDLSPFTQRPDPDSFPGTYVVAPGLATTSTGIDGGYSYLVGSSAAAPMVTGIIFLLQQWALQNHKFGDQLPPVDKIAAALRDVTCRKPNTGHSEFDAPRINNPRTKYFDTKEYYHASVVRILNKFKSIV